MKPRVRSISFRRARPGDPKRRASTLLAIGLIAIAAAGCSSGPKDFDNENDLLRRDREALTNEIQRLQAQLGEADAKIDELRAVIEATGDGPSSDVLAALPRCAGIQIDRLSGPIDRDGEPGYPESVAIYIRPYDGRQRFVQVAGTLIVEARFVPRAVPLGANTSSDADLRNNARDSGILLGRTELDPTALREAYRSGFMGTHYTVELTPKPNVRVLDGAILLSAVLLDSVTGRRHEDWALVRVDQ